MSQLLEDSASVTDDASAVCVRVPTYSPAPVRLFDSGRARRQLWLRHRRRLPRFACSGSEILGSACAALVTFGTVFIVALFYTGWFHLVVTGKAVAHNGRVEPQTLVPPPADNETKPSLGAARAVRPHHGQHSNANSNRTTPPLLLNFLNTILLKKRHYVLQNHLHGVTEEIPPVL
ncbi:hypothetical protein V5799_025418 [Amblyomma americanum]|uniref:Uncharacterized protein n=1 Tax=Amblyomma americanum TaxID=6943 RepID=A0AAQ4E9A3_AMBAM